MEKELNDVTPSVEDEFLSEACKRNKLLTIFLMNGFQMKARIIKYDEESIKVENEKAKKQLIYKHAISTLEVND